MAAMRRNGDAAAPRAPSGAAPCGAAIAWSTSFALTRFSPPPAPWTAGGAYMALVAARCFCSSLRFAVICWSNSS
jgi:hypothetical protein